MSLRLVKAISLVIAVGFSLPISAQQVWPGPTVPGSVLRYRLHSGARFRDSVLVRRGDTVLVERKRFTPANVLESRVVRRLVLGRSGGVVIDQFGSQRLFPLPWPPKRDWDYSYRGARYRYTPLQRESVSIGKRSLSALKVQLSVESTAGAVIADLWMVPNVGIVRTVTRPSGSPNDYELLEIRRPPVLPSSSPRPAPQQLPAIDTASKPAQVVVPVTEALDSELRSLKLENTTPRFTFQHAASGYIGVLTTDKEGTGMSATAGYTALVRIRSGSAFLTTSVTPLDLGIMPADPNSRYQSETTSSGTTVCRDQDTGQFAKKSNCAPRMIYAVNAEVLGGIPAGTRIFGFGAGVRGGNSSGPYAIAAFFFSKRPQNAWQIRARIGRRLTDFSIGGMVISGAR